MFGDYEEFLNEACVRKSFKDLLAGEKQAYEIRDVFDEAFARGDIRVKFMDEIAKAVDEHAPESVLGNTGLLLNSVELQTAFQVLRDAERAAKGLATTADRNEARYHARVHFLDELTRVVHKAVADREEAEAVQDTMKMPRKCASFDPIPEIVVGARLDDPIPEIVVGVRLDEAAYEKVDMSKVIKAYLIDPFEGRKKKRSKKASAAVDLQEKKKKKKSKKAPAPAEAEAVEASEIVVLED